MNSSSKARFATSALFRAIALSSVSIAGLTGALAQTAVAQTVEAGVLRGKVVDKARGINLQGALVSIPALNNHQAVDREGQFIFRSLPAGEYEIVVTYQGKEDIRQNVTIAAGQTANLALEMLDLSAGGRQDTIVVTASPIADSEAAAYSRQKASDKLINVVAADTIGRFPDQNVAGALSRLPGVSVERDQGQERYVNLRGAPNKWTTISFNGMNVISPEGRASRFDTIPNAIVSSIEATKAVTADMSAESIAGNINIITRSPFDYDGFKLAGEVGIGLMQLGGGEQNNYSLMLSDTFGNDKFGYLISGSFYRRNQVTDNVENRFEIANEDQAEGREDRIWSRQTDTRVYHLVRANKGLSARFDFRPNVDHEFYFSSIFTEFTDDEQRDQTIFDYDSDASGGCYADISCGNNPTTGTVYGVQIDSTFNTNNYRENIWTNTLGGDHFIAGWDMDWRLNYSYTEDEFNAPARYKYTSPSAAAERPTVFYDYTDPDYPITIPYTTIVNEDGTYSVGERWTSIGSENLDFTRAESIERIEPTRAWAAKIDFERQFDMFKMPTTMKFGGQYDTRKKSEKRTDTYIDEDTITAAGLTVPSFFDISTDDVWDGDFPAYWATRRYHSDTAVGVFEDIVAAGGGAIEDGTSIENAYSVTEDIYAVYGMATMDFNWGNIVAGLRYEQSENEGTAYGEIDGVDGYQLFTASDSRSDVFPSLHLNWDITEDQKFRVSFNSGLARPEFDDRAPNFSINDDEATISGGNPYAAPEKTYGVDAYYEWYLQPVGILSAGVFYKHIQDPLISLNVPTFGSTQFDTADFLRSQYEFDTTGNGENGYYTGLELAYAQKFDFLPEMGLPEWTDGFGFNGNLTLVDSEIELADGRKAPLNGSSDLTYNTSLYWEKYDFSVRVNWQWRTEWINSYGSDERFDRSWAELGRLSLGMRYQLNDNFEWFFDANNLTDQLGRRIRGDMSRVYEVEGFGVRYMTGLRFNY